MDEEEKAADRIKKWRKEELKEGQSVDSNKMASHLQGALHPHLVDEL